MRKNRFYEPCQFNFETVNQKEAQSIRLLMGITTSILTDWIPACAEMTNSRI
jgi:hypothetical protein